VGGLIPAISLAKQAVVEVNFGEVAFAFSCPNGYKSIHQWFLENH